MSEKTDGFIGCGLMILMMGFGLLQLVAGWIGIEETFGWGWGIAAVAAALVFRFTIPIVVGVFLCATDVWGWHWFFAVLLAAPGLLFMVPAVIASLVDGARGRSR